MTDCDGVFLMKGVCRERFARAGAPSRSTDRSFLGSRRCPCPRPLTSTISCAATTTVAVAQYFLRSLWADGSSRGRRPRGTDHRIPMSCASCVRPRPSGFSGTQTQLPTLVELRFLLRDFFEELLFAQYRDAELLCFVGLGSGVFAHNDKGCLF